MDRLHHPTHLHGWLYRWVAVPDEEWPLDDAQREVVLQDFDTSGTQGDRRQVRLAWEALGQLVL